MNINKNNLFARYYNWIYGELPQDVCSFFWGTVLSIVLSLIFVPGRTFTNNYDGTANLVARGMIFWMVSIVSLLVGFIPWIVGGKDGVLYLWVNDLPNWLQLLVFLVTGAIEIAIIVGIILGIIELLERRQQRKYLKLIKKMKETGYQYEEPVSFWNNVGNFIGAIRGKYCTKITWK